MVSVLLCALSAWLGGGAVDGGPATPPPPPPGHRLTLALSDEFEGQIVDSTYWGHVFADPAPDGYSVLKRTLPTNAERQVYFDSAYLGLGLDPFSLKSGVLTITAAPLSQQAHDLVQAQVSRQPPPWRASPVLAKLAYSSGLLSSRGRYIQKYGYFEMRARWTGGKGLWPAFWLLPAHGGWPPEIDIMEALGHEHGIIYSSIHTTVVPKHVGKKVAGPAITSAFHRYGAMWLPDRIDYYIDGVKTVSIPATSDMDQPMYILVNLAVGGRWPGDPDADTAFPAHMDVDYVKAWKLD